MYLLISKYQENLVIIIKVKMKTHNAKTQSNAYAGLYEVAVYYTRSNSR